MIKKIIFAVVIVGILGTVGLLGWRFLFGDPDTSLVETSGNLLPFGSGDNLDTQQVEDGGINTNGGISEEIPDEGFITPIKNLFQIASSPVAGFITIEKSGKTIIRYADRATGNIYDAILPNATSSNLEKIRVTNNTLPKIYEAHFKSDGNAVLFRSVEDGDDFIKNLLLNLTPPQASSTLYSVSSIDLRGDLGQVSTGRDNFLYYVLEDSGSIVSTNFSGTGARTLFSSSFDNWRIEPAGTNLLLYTKPSTKAYGYAYFLNSSNGAISKVLGPLNGLVAKPNSQGTRVAYSHYNNNRTYLFVKNLENNRDSEVSPATLAEKCAWSTKIDNHLYCGVKSTNQNTEEPDSWYRGETQFSDNIWRFDTGGEIAEILSEPKSEIAANIDMYTPKLSLKEDYLVFINRTDLSLWVLKLENI